MTSLTYRAERALLGALIGGADPGDVPPLQQEDFTDPHHATVFLLHQSGIPAGLADTAGFVRDCPNRDHARAYALMVIEARFRRDMYQHAVRSEASAGDLHYDARRLSALAPPGSTADDLLTRTLQTSSGAQPSAQRILGHELLAAMAIRAHLSVFDPGRDSEPAVGRQPGQRAYHEETVLASMLRQPDEMTATRLSLTGAAFTEERRELFDTITFLHEQGLPVDELTADWELARRRGTAVGVTPPDTSYAHRVASSQIHPAAVRTAVGVLTGQARPGGVVTELAPYAPAAGAAVPWVYPPPAPPGDPSPQIRM